MVKIVEVVTISKLIPIYKDCDEANAIQVAKFSFADGSECGFNVVCQKGLYEVGSKAIYIQPDYCLSDNSLFNSFISPGGDVKKSRLGKQNRIRAIKFNFQFSGSSDTIYSNGILLPISEVIDFIGDSIDDENLSDLLGVHKYEEPETGGSGLTAGDFPGFMYKTDETNALNLVSHIKKVIDQGQELGITIKRDGSSHTTYFKITDGEFISGVCSRGQDKKMEQILVTNYINGDDEYHRYINPETKVNGWFCDDKSCFKTNDEVINFTPVTKEVKDSWVELAKSSGLLDKGLEYCKENGIELAFRGEIVGQGLKGSGNKLNPDSNNKQKLVLFGVDDLSEGFSKRVNYSSIHNLKFLSNLFDIEYTESVVVLVKTYEELIEICENIFKDEKSNGRVIEGVVVRTMYTNDLSCKVMNFEYDSKK